MASMRSTGSGPGAQAADGCSVDLYRRLPYLGELDEFRFLFPPGARVVELGCAAGRLTRPLLAWGARVTAVDNCAEMLAAVPDQATRVLCDIEVLDLGERFDAALLASCLINHPDTQVRERFVQTARRHLRSRGYLLLERHDTAWLQQAKAEPAMMGQAGDVAMFVEAVGRAAGLVEMTVRYECDGGVWRHSFAVAAVTQVETEALLSDCGFGEFYWSGRQDTWLRAVAL